MLALVITVIACNDMPTVPSRHLTLKGAAKDCGLLASNKLTIDARGLGPRNTSLEEIYSILPWAINGILSPGCLGGSPTSFNSTFPDTSLASNVDLYHATSNITDRLKALSVRLIQSGDPYCTWMGINLSYMAANNKVKVYYDRLYNPLNFYLVHGFWRPQAPDEIAIWDGTDDLEQTAKHEVAHSMGRGEDTETTNILATSDRSQMGAEALALSCTY